MAWLLSRHQMRYLRGCQTRSVYRRGSLKWRLRWCQWGHRRRNLGTQDSLEIQDSRPVTVGDLPRGPRGQDNSNPNHHILGRRNPQEHSFRRPHHRQLRRGQDGSYPRNPVRTRFCHGRLRGIHRDNRCRQPRDRVVESQPCLGSPDQARMSSICSKPRCGLVPIRLSVPKHKTRSLRGNPHPGYPGQGRNPI